MGGGQAGRQAAVSFFNHCVQTANTLSWPPFETTVVIAAAAQGFINISVFGYPLPFNPNWHEAERIYPPYNFWIGFCQLNFYQKFPNIFGGEN